MKRYDNDDIIPGTFTSLNMRQEDAGENQILTSVSLALPKENSLRSRLEIMKMRRIIFPFPGHCWRTGNVDAWIFFNIITEPVICVDCRH